MLTSVEKLRTLVIPTGTRIISFDVFDTLIIRKVEPPEIVKNYVARRIVKNCILPFSFDEILKMRREEESRLRALTRSAGFDPECSIREIFQGLIKRAGMEDSVLPELLATELDVEKELVAPMPGMIDILKKLAAEYTLVATSDTYLSSTQIRELLDAAGYSGLISKIFASGDYRVGKSSGRLFKVVTAWGPVNVKEVLHVGDNFYADYLSARKMGLNAVFLYDEWNHCRKGLLASLDRYHQTSYWKSHSFIKRLISLERTSESFYSEYYQWGKHVVGPLLVVFTHLLYNEVQKNGEKHLFFIARDGYLLKKLFLKFAEHNGSASEMRINYLSISRYTAVLASIHDLGEREILLLRIGCNRLKEIFLRLGVTDYEDVSHIFVDLGLEWDETLDEAKMIQALRRLFAHQAFRATVFDAARRMREGLSSYLKQKGFFAPAQNVAFIDIGWLGTIQSCVEIAFNGRKDFPNLRGYYFALSPPIFDSAGEKLGLIYDYRKSNPEEMAISLFREAWEFSTRAFHGSTIGYRTYRDMTVPIYKKATPERNREQDMNNFIVAIHNGIYDFSDCYLKAVSTFEVDPLELKSFVTNLYDEQVSFPGRGKIGMFEGFVNTNDFGSEKPRDILSRISLAEIINLKKSMEQIISTPWREATLAKTRIPFLVTAYYIIKRLVCWRRIRQLLCKGVCQ